MDAQADCWKLFATSFIMFKHST